MSAACGVRGLIGIRLEIGMRQLLSVMAVVGAVALAFAVTSAQAQSGSTGGTIGKQGRSAAGETNAAEPRSSPAAKNSNASAAAKQRQGSGSACAKLVGVWLGPTNTDMIFKADQTVTSPAFSDAGPWTCSNGQVVIRWKQWGTDHCALTSEGTQMTCTNSLIGNSFSRSRKAGS